MNGLRITIDPGTQFTGLAVWLADEPQWSAVVPPTYTALLRPSKGSQAFEDRAQDLGNQLLALLRPFEGRVKEVACELPKVFDNSASMAAAKGGSLTKLTFVAGCYGMVAELLGAPFRPVGVNEWKGQLSKRHVMYRIQKVLGSGACAGFDRDIWDAVGIGLFLKGHL